MVAGPGNSTTPTRYAAVVGERSGFNGFACDQIWPAGHRRPTAFKLRLEFILAAAFVAYGLYATVGAAISALG